MARDRQDIGQSFCPLEGPVGGAPGAGFGIENCGFTGARASGAKLVMDGGRTEH